MAFDVEEYLNHWKVNYGKVQVKSTVTDEMRASATDVCRRASSLLTRYEAWCTAQDPAREVGDRPITSGWRPVEVNRVVPGAALYSNHTTCKAIDIADPYGDLDEWCLVNQNILDNLGLWLEHPSVTKGWCHVQNVPPRSGNRVFYP